MKTDRRTILGAGLGVGLGATTSPSFARERTFSHPHAQAPLGRLASDFGLIANTTADQTAKLQKAVNETARSGQPLWIAPGRYRVTTIELPEGAMLHGVQGNSILTRHDDGPLLVAKGTARTCLDGIGLEGRASNAKPLSFALLEATDVRELQLNAMTVTASAGHGLSLTKCAGRITASAITRIAGTGLHSRQARGLEIADNAIADCSDNGILVWQDTAREDGTLVTTNRIERIGAVSGGSGQYGNAINVFRAANVLVTANRIADCAYTAIRANAASNVQIIGNSCSRLGEVAIYAEFGFQGAIITSNLVEHAATGIAVTNFDHGGRLAVIQGNLVRDLFRRENEPIDKRGDGITVEADAAVTGNVVEGAPNVGLLIGWGPYMRDVSATGNVIRNSRIGIGITGVEQAGRSLIAQNLISNASHGAIRAFDHARPIGSDLAVNTPTMGRITITGNSAG